MNIRINGHSTESLLFRLLSEVNGIIANT